MKYTKEQISDAKERLQAILKPGDKVYTILRHVSSSGMMRSISLVVVKDNIPDTIDHLAVRVLGLTRDKNDEGIRVGGCGMDMGFHLVYELGYILFPNGFDYTGTGRNGDTSGHDNNGGYALKQAWL